MNRWWIWSVVAALRLCVLVLGSWCAARPVDLSTSGSECVEEPEITLDVSQRCIKYWTLVQQVHRLWTLVCAYICSDTSVKQKDLFLFRIIFPSIYVPQKTNEGRRQLAKVIVIIWKPSSVFLVNDYDLDSPLKATRYRNKHSLVSCDEEFPPDNVYKSIYPSRKNGADFVGECILSGDQSVSWFIQLIVSDCCSPWMQETNSQVDGTKY